MNEEYVLHPPTYEWTIRLFSQLKKILGINIKLHGDSALLAQGEIFLFNHFARMETFLPHYLIYQETGAFCRCIATKTLFEGNEAFKKYLIRVGVIPNNHEELLPMLVAEIIRGRKVVIFPEGSMIKDRRVVDEKGKLGIYLHAAKTYRKHHSGAAVLATAVDAFKLAVRIAEESQDWERIDAWVEMLELKNREHLLFAARRTTRIIPGNITFYPIHTSDNFLRKGAALLNTELSTRTNEELTIETNLMFKHTDMDMRLGAPICMSECQPWWERNLQKYVARNLDAVEDFFTLRGLKTPWMEKPIRRSIRRSIKKLRDRYMEGIYKEVTVNLSHLASTVILNWVDQNIPEVEADRFYLMVYLAVKQIQQQPDVHLHRSLRNPEVYADLAIGKSKALQHFLEMSTEMGLVEIQQDRLLLLEKLKSDFGLNTVRIENPIRVYANEIAPVAGALNAVNQAMTQYDSMSEPELAKYRHDDELRRYEWDYHYYNKPRFDDINRYETATESGRPFFEMPETDRRDLGVLLVHGFLASPAEVKPFSEKLVTAGYPVYAVRLPGHGTSPVDLRERSWEDWLCAVQRGYEILAPHVDKVCLVGFSTRGILSLLCASENPENLAGVVVINPPVQFQNKNMVFVPLLHGVSRLVRKVSPLEGIMSYRTNVPEHGRINYRNMPVRGLHELVRINNKLEQQLVNVQCPCLLMQSSHDPIITADSSRILQDGLVNADVSYIEVDSKRHGILYENVADTHKIVMRYIQQLLDAPPQSDCFIQEEYKLDLPMNHITPRLQ